MTKFLAWLALILFIATGSVMYASAAFLNWDADEAISLSDPAITLTILATSKSDSLTVKTDRIEVTVAANERFLLQSPRQLSVSGASAQATIGFLCRSGNITELDFRSNAASQSITITPQSGSCSGASGSGGGGGGSGGGGGGGGGGYAGTTSILPVPAQASLLTPPVVQKTTFQISVTSGFLFKKPLRRGSRGADVIQLQKVLVAAGFLTLPPQTPYGFLGTLTEDAVKILQGVYGIARKGTVGYGLVGPITRKKLNELILR